MKQNSRRGGYASREDSKKVEADFGKRQPHLEDAVQLYLFL